MGVWARADVRDAFEGLIVAHGDAAIGWKIGVASAASMAAAGIDAPLIGCLFQAGLLESGAELDVSGWVDPRLEPEIAVYLKADVPAGASAEQASDAIAAISLAFELVDLDGSLTDAPAMLRGNVFQRGVILGERVAAVAPPPVRVLIDGETHADIPDPIAAAAA
ncbi:hypothetical protein GCM10022286_20620 [Gryllotalpicola daejeonensis]|uniref:Uncharacterized protein n=1 Tax=Gryllotalpicola daejeonensis TaxID=993087 RepID=A0ABP7ZKU8_9MICO